MDSFNNLLKKYRGKVLLAILAHPDDESFIAGGLFLKAKEYGLRTCLLCLTKGGQGLNAYKSGNLQTIRSEELEKACKIIGIDEIRLRNYPDAELRETKLKWIKEVSNTINEVDPAVLLTFDHSGITGHPDHIVLCIEVLKIIRKLKHKPILIWRVPSVIEKTFFKKTNNALIYASTPNLIMRFGLTEALKKIKAIFTHVSQMQGFLFKLRILEWNLLELYELYYKVDCKKSYKYKFVFFKID